ncbi:MAG: DUF2075 domain-containing protein [Bermanella sp.]
MRLQTNAWSSQIEILQNQLAPLVSTCNKSFIFFEFSIPRMGRRADVVLVHKGLIFVIEFKVGSDNYNSADIQQAHGYAIDLKNFHDGSHNKKIIPILIATHAKTVKNEMKLSDDNVVSPILLNRNELTTFIKTACNQFKAETVAPLDWCNTGYRPTPTIIEAAQSLYANHSVDEISRSDAGAKNIKETSSKLLEIIHQSKLNNKKAICFVTGVPGAGKTLVGLNIATKHSNKDDDEYAVFLSGNGPLVEVLREALARDQSSRTVGLTKAEATRKSSQFIQNIHHFRDSSIEDKLAPVEKVVIFDEAQRAWDQQQTSKFMQSKRGLKDFNQSEPDFLISVMDRHDDWCVVIALVGGGQEINTGEAGISEWFKSIESNFSHWDCYCSTELASDEYVTNNLDFNKINIPIKADSSLHLATSMRSFRSENLSKMIHYLVKGDYCKSKIIYDDLHDLYPIAVTRCLSTAKQWTKDKARANETKGLIASSGAIRLKPEGVFVKNRFNAKEWFLNDDTDIRSCHYLEDVATEFDIQGLELDWCLVAWDADYRYINNKFEHWKFVGAKWHQRHKEAEKRYLENAYRVLLTRARQGFVIFIPQGNDMDNTRLRAYYDATFEYLKKCGIQSI